MQTDPPADLEPTGSDRPPIDPNRDMTPAELRAAGLQVLDWIAAYLSEPGSYPVLSRVQPGAIREALPAAAPERGEPFEQVLRDFRDIVVPGITHWNHPGFFAYFGITGSGPGILGELLAAALNVNGMLWQTSPAATELEEVALEWLRRMIGLPDAFAGVIMDTASVATLCAIAAAREAPEELGIRQQGLAGRTDLPPLVLYASDQAHSSVDKAAIVLGLGLQGVRRIATDREFRMRPDELEAAIRADRAAGRRPCCAIATVGTTSTTSVDPVPEIARICRRERLWLHVDAAYAGAAAIAPEFRHVLAGCEAADSVVLNPHKWMGVPIDCSAFYTRRSDVLRRAFSLVPEYLRTDADEGVTNYMDWGIQLGRRFRALKLWMVLRHYGSRGLADLIRGHIAMAREFADWVDAEPDFERLAPTPLSVVCFRARPSGAATPSEQQLDALNEELLRKVNAGGAVYLSHTRLEGRYTLRLAIGNLRTTPEHVTRARQALRAGLDQLIASSA